MINIITCQYCNYRSGRDLIPKDAIVALQHKLAEHLPSARLYVISQHAMGWSDHEIVHLMPHRDDLFDSEWQSLTPYRPDPWGLTGQMLWIDPRVLIMPNAGSPEFRALLDAEWRATPAHFTRDRETYAVDSAVVAWQTGNEIADRLWLRASNGQAQLIPRYRAPRRLIGEVMKANKASSDDHWFPPETIIGWRNDVIRHLSRETERHAAARDRHRPRYDAYQAAIISMGTDYPPWEYRQLLSTLCYQHYAMSDRQRAEFTHKQRISTLSPMRVIWR